MLARGQYTPDNAESLARLQALSPEPRSVWIASVAAPEIEAGLESLAARCWGIDAWFARTEALTDDLKNSYSEPARMGVDRWLAMLAARARHRGRICVVDVGSALTIDLVAADGAHEGGYIIPGPALMERALLLDTNRVRFDESIDYALSPGNSTAEAVRHGIAIAQAGAVALALEKAAADAPALYFCGGAGDMLMELLDRGGTSVPDLVFEGLELMATRAGQDPSER